MINMIKAYFNLTLINSLFLGVESAYMMDCISFFIGLTTQ